MVLLLNRTGRFVSGVAIFLLVFLTFPHHHGDQGYNNNNSISTIDSITRTVVTQPAAVLYPNEEDNTMATQQQQQQQQHMTVAVRLCHGMGNQVSQIIYANYWKQLLEETLPPVKVDIVVYYCDKTNRISNKLQCFPKLRSLPEMTIADMDYWNKYQTAWLEELVSKNRRRDGDEERLFFAVPVTGYRNKCHADDCERTGVETMRIMLAHPYSSSSVAPPTTTTTTSMKKKLPSSSITKNLSLPILHVMHMPDFRHWDRYYDSHKQLLS
jgi:hypothetical protein